MEELFRVLEDEDVDEQVGDIFSFDATAKTPRTEAFTRVRDAFAATYGPALARITGKPVRTADMRAYAYRAGHYLLPHTDHQDGVRRLLAYAFYLPTPEPPEGGELELFTCELAGEGAARTSTKTESALVIEAKPNRLVVFDVSDVSLHQVREVIGGLRLSLAGWFYP